MQTKTIQKNIKAKMNEWLATITDQPLRVDAEKSLLVSGGCISSMYLNEPVNDYDVYLQDIGVALRLAKYYASPDTGVEVMDVEQAASYLKVSERYMKTLRDRGQIKFSQDGQIIRYRKKDLDKWLDAHQVGR